MAENTGKFEDLRFVTGPARAIGQVYWQAVKPQLDRYYNETLVSRSQPEVDYFTGEITEENWANPNLAAGSRSRYRRTRSIAAFRGPYLTAQVRMAYNASSRRDGAAGASEEIAKLWSPIDLPGLPLAESRYVTVRDIVGTEDDAILGGMTAYLLGAYGSERTVTDYLYSDEHQQRARLERWGLEAETNPDTGEEITEAVHPFGPDADPEAQTKMMADTARDVIKAIVSVPAASQALDYINANVQRYDSTYIIGAKLMY